MGAEVNMSEDNKEQPREATFRIADKVTDFVRNIDGLRSSITIAVAALSLDAVRFNYILGKVLKTKGELVEKKDDGEVYKVPPSLQYKAQKMKRDVEKREVASKIVPQSFLVSLVSQFDLLIASIIREISNSKPECLNLGDKILRFKDIVGFHSLDEAKEFIINEEIESVLRKSHSDQVKYLSDKADVTLDKNKDLLKKFVELTERRNLFVHTGGKVSRNT